MNRLLVAAAAILVLGSAAAAQSAGAARPSILDTHLHGGMAAGPIIERLEGADFLTDAQRRARVWR